MGESPKAGGQMTAYVGEVQADLTSFAIYFFCTLFELSFFIVYFVVK